MLRRVQRRARNRDREEAMQDNRPVRAMTRRRVLTAAGIAGGASLGASAPWRIAIGQGKPFRIGTLQPLSGNAASGGKTALVGIQMAVDRINKSGGIGGRSVELIVADDESKPDVGRRKVEKMVE